ncbi:MAG: FHA domain-containing protein [Archangium sp.]|nr:FHA domain-containing protein [Archangium sp.]MDP3154319.1 FHA domain-containing protein [Archangium sp.]MDP3569733.1 FHA domain-containing protein [Archangium sp.]
MSIWAFLGSAGEGNDDFELLQSLPMREGIIGTDASCAWRLTDPMLTPQHARVLTRDDAWYIGGIAAASPTRVNGVATLPGEAVRLSVGDIVQLGSARFRFGGEPPPRTAIDPNDEEAVMVVGDRMAEGGLPLGNRILERQPPSPDWLPGFETALAQARIVPEWTGGLLTSLTVREYGIPQLKTIFADEAAVSLEQLTLFVATCQEGSEEEAVRSLLQLLAETRPPRLRTLDLGWLHAPLSKNAGRDWYAVARRIPLEGTLQETHRLAGRMRFTMLREGLGWPALGATAALPFMPDEAATALERRRATMLHANPGQGAGIRTNNLELRINGVLGESSRRLIHGDVVEGDDFTFRFEES